jgi:hypothetical protein
MSKIGLWQISEAAPARLQESEIPLERQLEEWIEQDPGLLQSGLTIVGRQIWTDGGPLDLLALDPVGRWVIIELKAEALRREAIMQAVDYASCIANMELGELETKVNTYLESSDTSFQEILNKRGESIEDHVPPRNIRMMVAGTGQMPGLERMVTFLGERYQVPISIVTFQCYEQSDGNSILTRALLDVETDISQERSTRSRSRTLDELKKMAHDTGIGAEFQALCEVAARFNFHLRPYVSKVMFAPPNNKTRMLFTADVETTQDEFLRVYVEPEVFSEFYPVSAANASKMLGESGWRGLSLEDIQEFGNKLEEMIGKDVQELE